MKRLSILSVLILIALFAIVFTLFARLGHEAFFFVTGPILGAMLAAFTYRRDRSALVTGGVVGGLCQGIFAILVARRGYIFPDIAMITGGQFLMSLGAHMAIGLVTGSLLYLSFRWASPRIPSNHP